MLTATTTIASIIAISALLTVASTIGLAHSASVRTWNGVAVIPPLPWFIVTMISMGIFTTTAAVSSAMVSSTAWGFVFLSSFVAVLVAVLIGWSYMLTHRARSTRGELSHAVLATRWKVYDTIRSAIVSGAGFGAFVACAILVYFAFNG